MNKAIFIDKDGTLIKNVPYNVDVNKIALTNGAGNALKLLSKLDYKIIVVSNQSGLARGLFTEVALRKAFSKMQKYLAEYDVRIDGFCYCPHLPQGVVKKYSITCGCRKPSPGLLIKAAFDYNISLRDSWMIGDILDDVEAGRRAGCRTILLDNGNENIWDVTEYNMPDFAVSSFEEVAQTISQFTMLKGMKRKE